ncbi:MAG: P-II family nitrogen regulator, partial [Trichococcus flocculiformis]
ADKCRKVFGIELDNGKDIIMNLVTSEVALAVETAIVDQMQLDVPGNGFLFSFDAENVRGVR